MDIFYKWFDLNEREDKDTYDEDDRGFVNDHEDGEEDEEDEISNYHANNGAYQDQDHSDILDHNHLAPQGEYDGEDDDEEEEEEEESDEE